MGRDPKNPAFQFVPISNTQLIISSKLSYFQNYRKPAKIFIKIRENVDNNPRKCGKNP